MPVISKFEIPLCQSKEYKIEVLSISLEYDQNLLPMTSTVKSLDFFDHISQGDLTNLSWYKKKLNVDLIDEKKSTDFALPHFYIRTNNQQLFNFINKQYTHIDLIFGQKQIYWKFIRFIEKDCGYFQEGETILDIGICPCCIDKHYLRIVEVLKAKYM